MSETVGDLVVKIGGDNSGLVNPARQSSVALSGIEKSAVSLGEALSRIGTTATATITAPLVVIGRLGMDALQSVERSMRNVAVATGRTSVVLEAVKRQIMEMSSVSGKAPEELAEQYAFLEKRGFGASSSLKILNEAMKLAKGTGEELGAATRSLAQYLVMTGGGAKEAAAGAALLYHAVNEGVSGLETFGRIMSYTVPMAQQLGVDMGTLAMAIASVDKKSANTRSSMGAMLGLFQNFINPSSKLQEVWNNAFGEMPSHTMKTKGLVSVLQKMQELNRGIGTQGMADIGFNSQDMRALSALNNVDLTAFSDAQANIDSMEKRLKSAASPLSTEIGKLRNEYKLMAMEVASTLMPVFRQVTGMVRTMMEVWKGLSSTTRGFITNVLSLAVAFGPLIMAVMKYISVAKSIGSIGSGIGSFLMGGAGRATATAGGSIAGGLASTSSGIAARMIAAAPLAGIPVYSDPAKQQLINSLQQKATAAKHSAREQMAGVPWQAYFNRDEKGRWRNDEGQYVKRDSDPLYKATRESGRAYALQKAADSVRREDIQSKYSFKSMAGTVRNVGVGDFSAYSAAVTEAGAASKAAAGGVRGFGAAAVGVMKGIGPMLARAGGWLALAGGVAMVGDSLGTWLGEKAGKGKVYGDDSNLIAGDEARQKRLQEAKDQKKLLEDSVRAQQERIDSAMEGRRMASAAQLATEEGRRQIQLGEASGPGLMQMLNDDVSKRKNEMLRLSMQKGMMYSTEYWEAGQKVDQARAALRREELAQLEREKSLNTQMRSAYRGAKRPGEQLKDMIQELRFTAGEIATKAAKGQDTSAERGTLISQQEQVRGMFSERVGKARQQVQDALEGRSEKTWVAKSMSRGSQEWGQAVLDRGNRVNEAMRIEKEQLGVLKLISDAMKKIPGVSETMITPYDLAEISL